MSDCETKKTNTPIILVNKTGEWIVSLVVFIAFTWLMVEYHRWRGKPYSLFTANKAIAITSCMLFSMSIALGPLKRLTGKLSGVFHLRRSLAIIGGVGVLMHVTVTLVLTDKFDIGYYKDNWLSIVFGVIAFGGFMLLCITSHKDVFKRLGKERWKGLHVYGCMFLFCVALHILVLGKYANWIKWFQTFDQPVPPGTMVPTAIVFIVVLIRIADYFYARKEC